MEICLERAREEPGNYPAQGWMFPEEPKLRASAEMKCWASVAMDASLQQVLEDLEKPET